MAGVHNIAGDVNLPEFSSTDNTTDELDLKLSLAMKPSATSGQLCRILTAEDFPSLTSRASPRTSSDSSVSSSSPVTKSHMVVGWPPVGSFRMNNLFNQSKEANTSEMEIAAMDLVDNTNLCGSHDNGQEKVSRDQKSRGQNARSSLLVKVNMDGDPIGRKVDLSIHCSYESLGVTLDLMFHKPTDGSSEFALTYEDKDGDWMLLGDVPWEMFLDTVKRLRIMRTCDANGLAPRFEPFSKANGCLSSFSKMMKPDPDSLWGD